MEVQRWILHEILDRLPVHPAAFAYVRGRSVVDCARRHLGARWLVKIDIRDFFGSVGERQVYGVFRREGYQPLPAFELARLCTWDDERGTDDARKERYPAIEDYLRGSGGFLPQGAPTSGALANLVVRSMDERLALVAARHRMVYTRYSDDMVFSSAAPFSRPDAIVLLREFTHVVQGHGFEANRRKTQIVPPGARKSVLGLLVDGDTLRLTGDFKTRVRSHLYGIERFGLRPHQEHRGFASMAGLVNHVDGLITYALVVEPVWARPVRGRWRAVLHEQGWPLP
ncbi:reverse transcriptase family protein [Streptomyces sp. SS8]